MSDIESKFFFLKGVDHFNKKDFLLAEDEFEKAWEVLGNRTISRNILILG